MAIVCQRPGGIFCTPNACLSEGDCVWRELTAAARAKADTKPTNPKDAIGSDKLPLHLVPPVLTAYASIAFLNSALKYGRANWRAAGVRSSIYVDAAMRHLLAWLEGEEDDPDDGVPHLAAVLACVGIILDARATGSLTDDRNYRGTSKAMYEMAPHVARLKTLHAERAPKHWTMEDEE